MINTICVCVVLVACWIRGGVADAPHSPVGSIIGEHCSAFDHPELARARHFWLFAVTHSATPVVDGPSAALARLARRGGEAAMGNSPSMCGARPARPASWGTWG